MSLYTLSEMDLPEAGVWNPKRVEIRQTLPTGERTVATIEESLGGKILVRVAPGCNIETMEGNVIR